ncbi:hypothetical protein [Sporanaerobacter sp. PP17-6a]|uniref:hypothetical protein n=1 Tax=Sporanaerobacter sp. PP17-6a TaxID=1891289 RepID=UPI00089F9D3A|nr:hypothetical protein [Sporanaerobacter sp. PP17-6a]SCL88403.1 hypothetical protein PP176A_1520 [Sporanaerobacter sp. PP17-6a]
MKRFIIPLIIILLVVVLFSINYKKKGTFEELVLNEYLDTAKAKNFDQIVFWNDNSHKTENDTDKIDEILNKFNSLQGTEYKDGPNAWFLYTIFLKNSTTGESLAVSVMEDNWLWIHEDVLSITENKKDNITEMKYVKAEKYFKVTDGNIDYDYFATLMNSIDE